LALERVRELEKDPENNVAIKSMGAGLIGSPQTIADRIRVYEDMGVSLLMLQFHPMKDGLKRFADDVLPLLR
jgi:FMNH2-dependent dimethyl sulfone monooxygenase